MNSLLHHIFRLEETASQHISHMEVTGSEMDSRNVLKKKYVFKELKQDNNVFSNKETNIDLENGAVDDLVRLLAKDVHTWKRENGMDNLPDKILLKQVIRILTEIHDSLI